MPAILGSYHSPRWIYSPRRLETHPQLPTVPLSASRPELLSHPHIFHEIGTAHKQQVFGLERACQWKASGWRGLTCVRWAGWSRTQDNNNAEVHDAEGVWSLPQTQKTGMAAVGAPLTWGAGKLPMHIPQRFSLTRCFQKAFWYF